jgi:hypothetical protein
MSTINKTLTIGVEIEMNGIARSDAAEIAAEFFGTDRHEYEGNGYDTYVAFDAQGRKWKFMRDSSINGPDGEKCELVTPILRYSDIETLQELVRRLRKAEAVSSEFEGCGIHVHIGAQDFTPQHLLNLVNIMASKQDLIYKALRVSMPREHRYCKKYNKEFIEAVNKHKAATLEDDWYNYLGNSWDRRTEHYNGSRYHGLNLHAYYTKGTVEFRLFNGTTHAGRIKAYIQFCLAMASQALAQKHVSPKATVTTNEKYTFRTWLLRMGLIGEEYATCRKFLLENLSGDIAFKNGRPSHAA